MNIPEIWQKEIAAGTPFGIRAQRALSSTTKASLPKSQQHTRISSREAVGTALKARIEGLLAIKATNQTCGCQTIATEMDRWGIAGCESRREEIVAKLVGNRDILIAALRTRAAEISVVLPMMLSVMDAIVPDAALWLGANWLLTQAIEDVRNQPKPVVRQQKPHHPPKRNEHQWWNVAEKQEAQRQLATAFIETIPPYVEGLLNGRGVVITGGGKYFVSAYVTIRVIRMVGCTLPIELWHLEGEMDPQMIDIVAPLGVTCHDASRHAIGDGYFVDHWWKGWQLKAYALLHSSFAEVLMLDADSYPVRDPSFVFDWPGYVDKGAIFWPDVGESSKMFPRGAAQSLGVPSFTETPTESGQMVVNKITCWRECHMVKHYNQEASYTYKIVYGDKDTFPAAWHRLSKPYARMNRKSTFSTPGILQLDHEGNTLFQHRIHDKFRLPGARFDSTPQKSKANIVASWQHESFCHQVVAELQAFWKGNTGEDMGRLLEKIMTVNRKFYNMQATVPDFEKLKIIEGVMLIDEYRLYQWFEAGRPANFIVDIGGHYGSFTAMAKTIWPDCKVLAYEPTPNSAEQFRRNTSEFKDATLIEAAAMGRPESPTIKLHLSHGGNDGGNSIRESSDHEFVVVKTASLVDDLNQRGRPEISILKIDCEGAELGILHSLADDGYLENVGYICGEWHVLSQIQALREILEPTHIVEFGSLDQPNGGMFAWRR